MRVILFNLYPYRTQRNQAKQRRVVLEILMAMFAVLVFCYLVRAELDGDLERQQIYLQELGRLESDIARQVAEIQSKKDRIQVLKRQIEALEAVERESLVVSDLMAYLDASIPNQVSLRRLAFEDGVLTLMGTTHAVADLASWLAHLEAESELFSKVDLVFVRLKENASKVEGGALEHEFEIKATIQRGGHGIAN
ncbi:MAG TPA: PilN domain-containing protein [Limnobacter sp.]|nr:PilN domain-containing protein [Limnobacter sp.]